MKIDESIEEYDKWSMTEAVTDSDKQEFVAAL